MAGGVDRARQAFDQQTWAEVHALLTATEQPLDAEDLERLAVAAYFVGRDDESEQAWERAHHVWLRLGDVDRAARAAFWLGLELFLRGEGARANGWFARGSRLVEGAGDDSAGRAYLLVPAAMDALERGDTGTCASLYEEVSAIAGRVGDADLVAVGTLGRGEAAVAAGDTRRGLALLDEAMVAATTGEVSPLMTGVLYCAVIDACVHAFDLRRAREWTDALARWCDRQGVVPFRGQCLIHRSQVLQANGEWRQALSEAESARTHLERSLHPGVGHAYYQQGEVHRLRGEHEAADQAYRLATEHGHDPAPGLALLRLAQGRLDAAVSTIRRMLHDVAMPADRAAVRAAFVEIMLAAGDVAAAREASTELTTLADETGAPLTDAIAAHAQGAVLLAEGDAVAALVALRRACALWRELGMPYECARSQELAGAACEALGDADAGEVELDVARAVFRRLGAVPDAERVADRRPAHRRALGAGPLTDRECEVLRLVAAGKTNREIGAALVISEHTAARHVQNIFSKLGVSSRAAATAHAYEHGIV